MKNSLDFKYEKKLWKKGIKYIAGVDEAGRGPIAGPVVAGAVIFKPDEKDIKGLNDSKKLKKYEREELYYEIIKKAVSIGVGVVPENIIDKINIYQATKLAIYFALNSLKITPQYILVDGMNIEYKNIKTERIIKGDAKIASIAAASIIAKVFRDRIMENYHLKYPQYKFNTNAGYPTKEHIQAIIKYGILPIHRKSFKPVKNIL